MKKFVISFLLIFFVSSSIFSQSAWTQEKGHGYFKLSQFWVIADAHYTDSGQIDPNVTSGIFNTSFYGQYGITDKWTAVLYFPFFSRAYFNNTVSGTTGEIIVPGEAVNSIGDTEISITYGILQKTPVKLSSTFTLGLPVGISSGGSMGTLQTGDGEFNQMLRVDAGTSFSLGSVNFYTAANLGINNRNAGFSDEFRYGYELGSTFWKNRIILSIRLTGIKSLNNGSSNDTPNSTSLFANNSEHFSWSPELGIFITEKIGVSATYGKAFSGRLIYANAAYSVGVFLKL